MNCKLSRIGVALILGAIAACSANRGRQLMRVTRRRCFVTTVCAGFFALHAVVLFANDLAASKIFGIVKVDVAADSIQLSNDPQLPGLVLIAGIDPLGVSVTTLKVNLGDSFCVSDRQHVEAKYKLLVITKGSALLEEITWTHFPGDQNAQEKTRKIRILPYDDRAKLTSAPFQPR